MSDDKQSQADIIVDLVRNKCLLFTNQYDEGFAAYDLGSSYEVIPIKSKKFKKWVSWQFFLKAAKSPSSETLNSALNTIEGIAIYEDENYNLSVRVAGNGNEIFYDLGDDCWQIIRLTSEGWEVKPHDKILFERHSNVTKQSYNPANEGNIDLIWRYCSIKEEDKLLFLTAVISSLIPDIPHPIVFIYGREGRIKSSTCKVVRKLIDPLSVDFQRFPKGERDAAIIFASRWIVALDNVSKIPEWLSDFLCRAVTGEGYETRELYTDKDTVPFSYRRVIFMNGIAIPELKPDAIDRCLFFEGKSISEEGREEESHLWAKFESDAPKIFRAMLDSIPEALKHLPDVRRELTRKPRMADFCVWGEAIARALGYDPFEFYNAYMSRIQDQKIESVEKTVLGELLLKFMKYEEVWEGQPSDLFVELRGIAKDLDLANDYPRTPESFGKKLSTIEESLNRVGLIVERWRDTSRSRTKYIKLYWNDDDSPQLHRKQPSEPSEPSENSDRSDRSDSKNNNLYGRDSNNENNYVTIKLIKVPPKQARYFKGADDKDYRLEEIGQVITLPKINAEILLKNKIAVSINNNQDNAQ